MPKSGSSSSNPSPNGPIAPGTPLHRLLTLAAEAVAASVRSQRKSGRRPTTRSTLAGGFAIHPVPILIVTEGTNDFEFLVRLVTQLRADDPTLPDLRQLCSEQRIAALPLGGGDPIAWPDRFFPLGVPEFHLYDREQAPEDKQRMRAIERVNVRPDCRGYLTTKRSLENYLHPAAIQAAGGGEITFGDHDSVAQLLAQHWRATEAAAKPWETLSYRTHRRLTHHAKRWLNTVAVEHMTAVLLGERDPAGEVLGWLRTIGELAGAHRSGPDIT